MADSFSLDRSVTSWLFAEFLPLGDLISDFVLLKNIPLRTASDGSTGSNTGVFEAMRWLLWIGTMIDAIPTIALLSGLLVALVIVLTLGPATKIFDSAEGEGPLRHTQTQSCISIRYALSEGKAATLFILKYTEGAPREWINAVPLVMRTVLLGPQLAFAWPLKRCLTLPQNQWFAPLIFIQAIGGAMTEVSSIYFAATNGDAVSIVSAIFGLYASVVILLVALMESRKHSESLPFDERQERMGNESRRALTPIAQAVGLCIALGLPVMAVWGVYEIEARDKMLGSWMAGVGFALWLVFVCLSPRVGCVGVYVSHATMVIVLVGLGVVHHIVVGLTVWVISLHLFGGIFVLVGPAYTRLFNHTHDEDDLGYARKVLISSVGPCCVVASPIMALWGVYEIEAGKKSLGRAQAGVGFPLWLFAIAVLPGLAEEWGMENCHNRVILGTFPVVLGGLGVVYHMAVGITATTISLYVFAGIFFCIFSCLAFGVNDDTDDD